MLETQRAVFIHIPKCGGTWVKGVLEGILPNTKRHGNVLPKEEHYHLKRFGFIRNPWSWYVSWYNFIQYGSDTFKAYREDTPLIALKGDISFESFIRMKCNPSEAYKRKLIQATFESIDNPDIDYTLFKIAREWSSSSSYFEHMYDLYLSGCHTVGRVESIQDDLKTMLGTVGHLTPELSANIDNTPAINVGNKKVDYRTYYTDETAQLVADTHTRIITNHRYTF